MKLPATVSQFKRVRPKFEAWLIANGSAVHAPTNPYEVTRFLTDTGIGVIYCDAAGRITKATNGADRAFAAWKGSKPWRAVEKVARNSRKRANIIKSLMERDGNTCAFCGGVLSADAATVEHFVPRTSGGADHLANMMLACKPCNARAGHLDVRGKLEMAIKQRSAA